MAATSAVLNASSAARIANDSIFRNVFSVTRGPADRNVSPELAIYNQITVQHPTVYVCFGEPNFPKEAVLARFCEFNSKRDSFIQHLHKYVRNAVTMRMSRNARC